MTTQTPNYGWVLPNVMGDPDQWGSELNNTLIAVDQTIFLNTTGVSSFNTRTGAITLIDADISGAGGALIANPTFSGTVTIPSGASLSVAGGATFTSAAFSGTVTTPTLIVSTAVTLPAGWQTGVTDGSNAPAGVVGEYLLSSAAGNMGLTSGTAAQVMTLALPPGDWQVTGGCYFTGSSVTAVQLGLNTSAAMPALGTNAQILITGAGSSLGYNLAVGPVRMNISANTTAYLMGEMSGASLVAANAQVQARRMR
jgi:hypothetical protein